MHAPLGINFLPRCHFYSRCISVRCGSPQVTFSRGFNGASRYGATRNTQYDTGVECLLETFHMACQYVT